jgi:hypothetical protein
MDADPTTPADPGATAHAPARFLDSPAMGGVSASTRNVNFAFDQALEAARDLYTLSGVVTSKHEARATEAGLCVDGWEGGKRTDFDTKMSTEGTDVSTISGSLVTLANRFASEWAAARGEQDRINFARYVENERDNDGWLEDGAEFFAGENDLGAPPDNPPVPASPDYAPTREPIHPEFE